MCLPSYQHCVPVSLTRLNCLFVILLQVFRISAFSVFLCSNDLFLILLFFPVYSKFLQLSSTMVFSYISKKRQREHKIKQFSDALATLNNLLWVDDHFNNSSKHLPLTFLFLHIQISSQSSLLLFSILKSLIYRKSSLQVLF